MALKSIVGKKTGKWQGYLFLGINALVIAAIILNEFTSTETHLTLNKLSFDVRFLFLGLGCFLLALFSEYWKYRLLLRSGDGKNDTRAAFGCAVLGKYYDNITPMGAGGQPFQIFYLKKQGFSDGVSGAAPIAGFLGLQFSFILLALLVLPLGAAHMKDIALIRGAAWLGLLCYALVPVCILLFSAAPEALCRIVKGGTGFLQRLHLLKDGDKAFQTSSDALRSYCDSMRFYHGKGKLWLPILGLSLLFRIGMLSMPYFVLRCFSVSANYFQVFSQVVYIYAAISLIPTPGNAGAAEGTFYMVFDSLAAPQLSWAVLLWRLLSYYGWLLLGFFYQLFAKPSLRQGQREAGQGAAQFVDVFFPTVDGVVRTVDAYAKRLPNGCVVCPGRGHSCIEGKKYDVIQVCSIKLPCLSYRLPLPCLSRKLKVYLREHPFSVFHAHSPFTMGHFALRMGRRLGVPVVASFHSKYYDDVLCITKSRMLARLVTHYIVRFYERADQVWACSAGTAETLRGYGYKGEILVMDNGVDMEDASDSGHLSSLAVKRFNIPANKRILLFVGQQIWQKNLKLVLDSCRVLKEKSPDYLLLVAGCGYNEGEIRDYANEIGLNDSVRFLGKICDRKLLMGLYQASDLFFFPSIYDNAPLVLREAALAGLPALVLQGSNAAEVITDGVNGFTEENDSRKMAARIQNLFQDEDLKAIGEQARRSIPTNWDDIVSLVQRRYQELRLPEASRCR